MRRAIQQSNDGAEQPPIVAPTEALTEEIAFLSQIKENTDRAINDNRDKITELTATKNVMQAEMERMEKEKNALEVSVNSLSDKEKNIERAVTNLFTQRDVLDSQLKEKSALLATMEVRGKSATEERTIIEGLTKDKSALSAIVSEKESLSRSLEMQIASAQNRRDNLSTLLATQEKMIAEAENKLTDLRAIADSLMPNAQKAEAIKRDLAVLAGWKDEKERDLAKLNTLISEKSAEVGTKQAKSDELSRIIAEKEKGLKIINEMINAKTRREEVEAVRETLKDII